MSNLTTLQLLAEFVVPLGGYTLLPNANPGAHTPGFVVASQPVPELPDLVAARANALVWALSTSTSTGLATLILVLAAFALIALRAAKDRWGHKCTCCMQQQQQRAPPRRSDGLVAVRLMDVEPLPLPRAGAVVSSSSSSPSSDSADDSAWTFDFAHEALIDQQVGVTSVQRMEPVLEAQHGQAEHKANNHNHDRPSQKDAKRAALKSCGVSHAYALGASLLHSSSSSSSSSAATVPRTADMEELSAYRAPSSSALMSPGAAVTDDAYASL